MERTILAAVALTLMAACTEQDAENFATELASDNSVGQEQACAGEFSQRYGVDMNSVPVNSRDTAPSGNAMIFLQSGAISATCEVDDDFNVVALTGLS